MFNQEQLEFINSPLINLKLIGIPGGGKTRCIIEHIHQNIKNNNLKNNNEYLIVTFSRKARQDFIQKGRNYVGKIKFCNSSKKNAFVVNNVKTIHSLSGLLLKKFNKTTSSLNTCVLGGLNILQNEDVNLDEFQSLKIIYIDEAQDISQIQNDFIQCLSQKINAKLCYIGDPNQNIYQFQDGSDKYLLDFKADKTVYLKTNYRSTPQLIELFNNIMPHHNHRMISSKTGDYTKPHFIIQDYETIENDIVNTLLKTNYKYENIAILSPVKLSRFIENKENSKYSNLGLSIVRYLCIKNRIPFVQHYNDGNLKFDNEKTKIKEGHVNLMTIHGSKGLEFDLVLVLNYHHRTMSKIPSQKEYEQFQYLMYVAMTRAKYQLKIYIDIHNVPFKDFFELDPSLYTLDKHLTKTIMNNTEFKEEIIQKCGVGITEFIQQLKPNDEYKLEELLHYSITQNKIFDQKVILHEYDYFGDFYGNFIESYFEYYYYRYYDIKKELSIIKKVKDMIYNIIIIKENYINAYYKFKKRFSNCNEGLTIQYLDKYLNYFSNNEKSLYYYIKSCLNNDIHKIFYLKLKDKLKMNDYQKVLTSINQFENNPIQTIMKLCIFIKSNDNESGYLWNIDLKPFIQSIQPVIQNIHHYIQNLNQSNYQFQVETIHPKLPFIGIIDILDDNSIIDIKFTSQLHNHHIYQLILYYNNYIPNWKTKKELKIINLFQGMEYIIQLEKPNTWKLNTLLCELLNVKLNNPIFIYDLETTSLDTSTTKIIQRHFEEYNLDYIPSSGYLKGNVPNNHITGLTTSFLYNNGDDLITFINEINTIFKYCNNPVFIAHNGNSFDHIIMKNQKFFNDFIKIEDSKIIIRTLINEFDTLHLSLEKIYYKLFNKTLHSHNAVDDVIYVKEILKKLKY